MKQCFFKKLMDNQYKNMKRISTENIAQKTLFIDEFDISSQY